MPLEARTVLVDVVLMFRPRIVLLRGLMQCCSKCPCLAATPLLVRLIRLGSNR